MGKGSSGSQQVVQQNVSQPWSGVQPYLTDILGKAQQTYNSGKGFQNAPFSTVVPFAPQTTAALGGIETRANAGNPLGDAATTSAQGILSANGLTPGMSEAANGFRGLISGAQPNAVGANLAGYANGSYVNGGSPEFNRALDYQAGKTADDVNRTFGNEGRYGSASHAQAVTDAVGNLRTNAMANEIAREQGQQIQTAGMLSGEQQQGYGNKAGALGNLANIGGQGASNVATFANLAPGLYDSGFAPYEKLAGVGSAYEDLSSRNVNDAFTRWQQDQSSPWQRLAQYSGLVNGGGSVGGTTTTSVPKPSALQGILSGGLTGASMGSMFGGPGALIGGGLGGLLGLFG